MGAAEDAAAEDARALKRLWAMAPGWARVGSLLFIGVAGGGGASTLAIGQMFQHDHRELTKPQAVEVEAIVDRKIEQKLEVIRSDVRRLEGTTDATAENVTRLLISQGVEPVRRPPR